MQAPDQDEQRRRIIRGRNIALALVLAGLAALFYAITLARLGS